MIAQAYSPVVLVILGVQMTKVKSERLDKNTNTAYWSGMAIRLLIGPIVALVSLKLLHIEGMLYSVLLVLACMPVAVNAGILAEKFDASPKIVTKSILWTTTYFLFLITIYNRIS